MPKFELKDFCSIIQEYKVTLAYIVPPIVLQLSKNPIVDNYDLSSLRMASSGAAPLTKELVEQFYARLKVPVKQGYGMSEASPTTHVQTWDTWQTTIGAVGMLLPNQIAKYINEKEEEVPAGETGELWIKGPNIFQGYLNNPEGTKSSLTEDGYYKTGDVGFQDKDGNFYVSLPTNLKTMAHMLIVLTDYGQSEGIDQILRLPSSTRRARRRPPLPPTHRRRLRYRHLQQRAHDRATTRLRRRHSRHRGERCNGEAD